MIDLLNFMMDNKHCIICFNENITFFESEACPTCLRVQSKKSNQNQSVIKNNESIINRELVINCLIFCLPLLFSIFFCCFLIYLQHIRFMEMRRDNELIILYKISMIMKSIKKK